MAKGYKTGGRKRGTPNKVTQEIRDEITSSGEQPLEYMIRIMRDPSASIERRDDLAKAAAPYLHARLAAIEHQGDALQSFVIRIPEPAATAEEWEVQVAKERDRTKH